VGETRREQVANWITSKNNKMFSKVMANRLWKKVFGVGLVEPVDDWKDNTPVLNPELMEALADIFIDVEYDLKAFLTILYNTEAYQMSVNGKKELMIKNYKIQGAMLRRMTAEQIWDSLLTLGVGPRSVYRDDVHEGAFDYHEKRRDFMIGFVKGGVDIVENYKGIEIYKGNVDEFKDYIRSYIPKALEFSSQYKIIESWKIPVLNEATAHPRIVATSASLKNLKRASDGNKKESSFVKLFGASKREQTVHGGSLAANLVQPLELLNGSTIKQMTSTGSYIMQRIMLEKSNKRKLEVLTYSLFSRKPSSKEFSILKKHLNLESQQKSEEEKWQSFLIAFINSPEFIFIQ
jgi:hypothetical protein